MAKPSLTGPCNHQPKKDGWISSPMHKEGNNLPFLDSNPLLDRNRFGMESPPSWGVSTPMTCQHNFQSRSFLHSPGNLQIGNRLVLRLKILQIIKNKKCTLSEKGMKGQMQRELVCNLLHTRPRWTNSNSLDPRACLEAAKLGFRSLMPKWNHNP